MDTDKKICVLTLSDVPDLAAVEAACFAKPWSSREFEACMLQDHFHALGIRVQHIIIAYVTFFFVVDEMEIVNLAVRKEYRRMGWGQFLFGGLRTFARDHRVHRIFLEVRNSNLAARELYVKNGFSLVGVRTNYYALEGEDALIMECVPEASV